MCALRVVRRVGRKPSVPRTLLTLVVWFLWYEIFACPLPLGVRVATRDGEQATRWRAA